MEPLLRNTYIEIDTNAIYENAKILTEKYPHKTNIAVVKGNAYGHGYGIIPALIKGGMNAFAVSNLYEALQVRKYDTEHPVIMLQPIHREFLQLCSENNISVCIVDKETMSEAVESGLPLKIHVKIDCGMNRLGFKKKTTLNEAWQRALTADNITIEGLFSHLHTSGRLDKEYSRNLKTFTELISDIDLSLIPIVHLDRTQTALLHKPLDFVTGARFGIALYGFSTVYGYSSGIKGKLRKLQFELKRTLRGIAPCEPYTQLPLKKAFNVYSEVIQVKEAQPGDYVGYGLMHPVKKPEYIAVIDTGYADGIGRRRFQTPVAINGKLYPIIGDVGMGMCEVSVDSTVKKYDRVTVFGGIIPSTSITGKLQTTIYEAMTNYDSSIPRIYV